MKKIVKIMSCTGQYDWYKDCIGEVYELKFVDNHLINTVYQSDYVVDMGLSTGQLGSVYALDALVKEVEDDVIVREVLNIPTDVDKLKAELEMTQNALNELLMNTLGGM